MTLAELLTIYINLHAMKFPLIFGETNFAEVPKIHEIYGPRRNNVLHYYGSSLV